MERNQSIRAMLYQAIAAVVITAVAYASSYFFESGYLSMFGVAMMLTQVTTSVLIIGVTTTLMIGATLLMILYGVFNIPTKGRPMRLYIQMLCGIAAIGVITFIIAAAISDTIFAVLLIPVIIFCVFSFFFLLLTPLYYVIRKKSSFRSFIERNFAGTSSSSSERGRAMNAVLCVVLGAIIIATSFSLGRYSAASKKTYSTTERDGVCYVIVRKYGEELIAKTVNDSVSLRDRNVTILKMSDGMNIKFIDKEELNTCTSNLDQAINDV